MEKTSVLVQDASGNPFGKVSRLSLTAAVSGGKILHRKRSLGGVTMAAALAPLRLTWSRD